MNDKIETPQPSELPKPESLTSEFSYTSPHILVSASVDESGNRRFTVQEGRTQQVSYTNVAVYSDELVEEEPLNIRMTNKITFGGNQIDVLNDAIDLPGLTLPASVPSATEYLALRGKTVLTGFLSRRDPKLSDDHLKNIYRYDRQTIVLP